MDKIGKCVYSQRNEMEFLFVEDINSEETISLIKQFICKYTTLCFSKKASEKIKFKKQFNGLKELEESSTYWSEYDVPLGIVERIHRTIRKFSDEHVSRSSSRISKKKMKLSY